MFSAVVVCAEVELPLGIGEKAVVVAIGSANNKNAAKLENLSLIANLRDVMKSLGIYSDVLRVQKLEQSIWEGILKLSILYFLFFDG